MRLRIARLIVSEVDVHEQVEILGAVGEDGQLGGRAEANDVGGSRTVAPRVPVVTLGASSLAI